MRLPGGGVGDPFHAARSPRRGIPGSAVGDGSPPRACREDRRRFHRTLPAGSPPGTRRRGPVRRRGWPPGGRGAGRKAAEGRVLPGEETRERPGANRTRSPVPPGGTQAGAAPPLAPARRLTPPSPPKCTRGVRPSDGRPSPRWAGKGKMCVARSKGRDTRPVGAVLWAPRCKVGMYPYGGTATLPGVCGGVGDGLYTEWNYRINISSPSAEHSLLLGASPISSNVLPYPQIGM